MGAYTYNPAAASNTDLDGVGSQGSNRANLIDNLARTLGAALANFVRDLGAANTSVGGTADIITVALADISVPTAYFDGMIFSFRPSADNTSTVTLNVDSLGAKALKKAVLGVETALVAGDLQAGQTAMVVYRSAWASAAGAFELLNPANIAPLAISTASATITTVLPTTIELGHATDTTLARLAAGDVGIEGQQIISTKALTITAANQAAARTNISAALKGQIFGLTLSNNVTDATNDIDIAAGEAASTESNPVLMVLASALTKRLDAAWAVGTGNGGLDTGAIANTTYHVWLIRRSDTGVVDALFSTSATSPTMPTNYDQKRRIGSIIRASAAIVGFKQVGDTFRRNTKATDRNSSSAVTDSLITLSVPTGLQIAPILMSSLKAGANTWGQVFLGSAALGTTADIEVNYIIGAASVFSGDAAGIYIPSLLTNTSGQIYLTHINGAGTQTNVLETHGWVDTRGKNA